MAFVSKKPTFGLGQNRHLVHPVIDERANEMQPFIVGELLRLRGDNVGPVGTFR